VTIATLSLLATALAAAEPATLEKVTFGEVVRRALERSTTTVVAAEEVRRADGLLGQARSGSLPGLVATGIKTRLDADRVLASGAVAAAKDQTSGSLSLTVPLVVPARWFQWAHGSQFLDAAVAGQADAQRSAAIAAGRAYLTIIAAKRVVEVSERARETAKAHYEFARTRRGGGLGNRLDELRAEQELAASEVQVENSNMALARSREALGILVGGGVPLDAAGEPTLPELPQADQAVAEAEARRGDVQAARARAYVAERTYADSWADWLPTLAANWQGIYQDPPTLTTPKWGWQAQLVLQFPLLEGGLRVGQARERSALSNEAQAQLDGTLRQARSDVRLAFESLQRARAALRAAGRGADSARAALDLANQAYRAGAVNNLEVIDAERQARDAATSAVIAEDGARQALLDLLSATGRFP